MNKIEFKQFLQNTKDNIQEKLNPKKIGTKISVSLKSKKTRKNLIIYAFLTLFCIAFLLLLSASTSPLYNELMQTVIQAFHILRKSEKRSAMSAYRVI